MKRAWLLVCIVFSLTALHAQQFGHVPRNIQKAVKNGTRTETGLPGKAYWQNKSAYDLQVHFNPGDGMLTGSGTIIYTNNSPDTLKNLIFRLYQNIYKAGAARNIAIKPEELTDGLIVDSVSIGSVKLDLANERVAAVNGTNLNLRLPAGSHIPPASQGNISIYWHLTVPQAATIRFGKISPEAYFIALWYPQLAVYDDIDGWDRLSYNGEQEFYNNHNDFKVSITVPSNAGVWATGDLLNPSEVFQKKYLDRYNTAMKSYDKTVIISKEEIKQGGIYNNASKTNTWKFSASSIPDFAFGTGSIFRWEAGLAKQPDNKPVFVNAVYREESDDYEPVWDIAVKTVEYFGSEFPGVPFPHKKVTVFNGRDDYGGGMEWPMIVNDPSYEGYRMTVWVTVHELAHMYMPFLLGTNERKYAWMDEGWAVMSSFDIQTRLDSTLNLRKLYRGTVSGFAGAEMEVPPMVPTMMLNGFSQQFASYIRSAFFLDYLRETMGHEAFNSTLKKFVAAWSYKHPTGYDFLNFFANQSGQDLAWYIQPWMFDNVYPDVSVQSAEQTGSGLNIKIHNAGAMPVPLSIRLTDAAGNQHIVHKTPAVWKSDLKNCEVKIEKAEGITKIELLTELIPDTFPADNIYQMK